MIKATTIFLLAYMILEGAGVPLDDMSSESLCYEHSHPSDPSYISPVECLLSSKETTKYSGEFDKDRSAMRLASFKCTESPAACKKAEATFQIAFDILSNVIEFKRPVDVRASYVNYCRDMQWCRSSLLGYAGPARSIKLKGTDGKRRLYPQALVKQMNLSEVPKFNGVDIQATFNSEARFWFQVDSTPIKRGQYDFLSVILHELIHGLGFTTQWNNYSKLGLTPRPNFKSSRNGGTKFVGFTENAFDQYLVEIPTMRNLTEISDKMSKKLSQQHEATSKSGIFRKFQDTAESQFPKDLLKAVTQPKTIAFLPKNANGPKDLIFLETSIRRFTQGSSLCHLDYRSNLNSPDFVMKYKSGPGSIQAKLNQVKLGKYSPLGPKLIDILETLGYTINPNPKPLSEILPNWRAVTNTAQGYQHDQESDDNSSDQFFLW